eukprot:scaffold84518_cov35-Tisochrysis_lutea.AAC.3
MGMGGGRLVPRALPPKHQLLSGIEAGNHLDVGLTGYCILWVVRSSPTPIWLGSGSDRPGPHLRVR